MPPPPPRTLIFNPVRLGAHRPLRGGRGRRKGRSGSIAHSPLRPPPLSRLFPESRERNKVDTWPTRGGGPLEHALSASIHFSRSSARDTLTAELRFFRFRYRDVSPISSISSPFSPRIVFYSPLFVPNINLYIYIYIYKAHLDSSIIEILFDKIKMPLCINVKDQNLRFSKMIVQFEKQ